MGRHIVTRGPPHRDQEPTPQRLTTEIPKQQLFALIRESEQDDLEPEIVLADGELVYQPECTPTYSQTRSARRLVQTMPGEHRSMVTSEISARRAPAVAPKGSTTTMRRIDRAVGSGTATVLIARIARHARVLESVATAAAAAAAAAAPAAPATSAATASAGRPRSTLADPRSSFADPRSTLADPRSILATPRPGMMMQRLRLIDVAVSTPFGAATPRWLRFPGAERTRLVLSLVLAVLAGGSLAVWLLRSIY
jgi:hypothetical protein